MYNLPKNKELSLKIQKLKAIVKALERLECEENNQEAGVIAQLLKMMSDTFEEVEQRLMALEKNKPSTNPK